MPLDDPRLHLQPGERVYLKPVLPGETAPNEAMRRIAGTEVTIAGTSSYLGYGWFHIQEDPWNYYYTAFEMPAPNFNADEDKIADLYR